jgi:hypothetical protein
MYNRLYIRTHTRTHTHARTRTHTHARTPMAHARAARALQNPIVAFNNAKLEKLFVKHLIQQASRVDAAVDSVRQRLNESLACPTPWSAPAAAPARPSLVRPAVPAGAEALESSDTFAPGDELSIPRDGAIGLFQTGVARRTSEGARRGSGAGSDPRAQSGSSSSLPPSSVT